MASLLRSGKFFRLFSNLTRSFDLNSGGRNNNESLVCARRGEWEIQIHRSLSTAQLPLKNLNDPASQQSNLAIEGVQRALEKAELDAKRLGRITKEDVLNIVEQIKQQKSATTTQSLLLIRCCGNLVAEEPQHLRTKLVQDVWKMFESFGVAFDISHYNALLRVYLENEHSFNPMKFLETLELKNVQPNRVTYQRLISAYCQKGNIDGASQILEIMKEKDLPIGEIVFNSLVMGHANTGDFESARSVIKVMAQAGIEPDSETYKVLLCGFAKNGMSEELSATLSDCRSKDINLHDRDLLEIVFSAAIGDHLAIVDSILKQTKKFSGYNQDCVNIILRLINQRKEDAAFKVFSSMKPAVSTDRQGQASGGFFIRQLVRANCAPEKIVAMCRNLVDSGLNNRAFFRALETANALGKSQIANVILKEIPKQKDSLRPQAFWPLLTSQSKASGEKGILDTLRQMAAVQVMPNVDTINQHVLPHMAGNYESLLKKLRSVDVPPSVVAVSLIIQSLNKQDFQSAIEVASKIFLRFDSALLQRAAADAYLQTQDAASLTKLICSMLRQPEEGTAAYDPKDRAAEMAGPILIEVLNRAPKPKLDALEPLLNSLHQSGIGISQNVIQLVQETVGDEMTESVAQLLVELGSGKLALADLIPFPSIVKNSPKRTQKFIEFVKSNKLEEALKEKEYLDSQNFVFTDALNILLMDLYARHERFEEALTIFKSLHTNNAELTITPPKLFGLATSLLKANRTEDAFKVLEHLKPIPENSEQNSNILEVTAWRMLNVGAMNGDIELTRKIFEILEQKKLKITGMIAGPLVKVHLNKDDMENALNTFLQCVEKYRVTPLKSVLTTQLIEKEDTQRLQQVMDASIKVHGEMNSLYDLVFAFLECGRVRQAKKVLETPGLRARSQRIETVCKRYVDEKRITELENLVKITRDVYGIDRAMMFSHLLSGLISTGDATRASALWTQMQEEDVKPTVDFLRTLGNFLQEKNHPVPFAIPDVETAAPTQTVKNTSRSTVTPVPKASENRPTRTNQVSSNAPKSIPLVSATSEKLQLLSAIKDGNVENALESKKKMETKGESLTIKNKSEIIELAVKANRLDDAKTLVLELVQSGGYPLPRVFRFFMKSLAAVGDHHSIKAIGQYLDEAKKSLLSYENILASAISLDPVSAEAYVDSLLNEVRGSVPVENQNDREEQLKSLRNKFPRGGILAILEKNPSLLAKCRDIATEYVKLGIHAPLNSLWCHYLNNGNMTEAEEAWEILKSCPIAIGFQPVCRHLRQHEDTALAEKLITMLTSSSNIKPSALGVAYSAWIDVHRTKTELESAISTLNAAIKAGVDLTLINDTTLSNLKTECEKAGKAFPFSLPPPSEKPKARSEDA